MAEGYYPFGFGDRAAPLFLALAAAALPAVLLLSTMMHTAGAAEQPLIIAGNGSLCSGFDGDGGGCLAIAIAQAQPELEGFEMAPDLASSGVIFHRSLQANGGTATRNTFDPRKAACGRNKRGQPYYSCLPSASLGGPNPEKCGQFKRGNPCRP